MRLVEETEAHVVVGRLLLRLGRLLGGRGGGRRGGGSGGGGSGSEGLGVGEVLLDLRVSRDPAIDKYVD